MADPVPAEEKDQVPYYHVVRTAQHASVDLNAFISCFKKNKAAFLQGNYIGCGSFGYVYHGQDSRPDCPPWRKNVALKFLPITRVRLVILLY